MIIYGEIVNVEIIKNSAYFWINKETNDKIIVPLKHIVSYGKAGDIGCHCGGDKITMNCKRGYALDADIKRVVTLTNGIIYLFRSPSSIDFTCFVDAFEKYHSPPESVDLLG